MKTATHPRRGRRGTAGGMFVNGGGLPDTPEARALVARLDASTTEFYAERDTHIRQVALVVLKAWGGGAC